ncbi:MAG: hypothetical protein A2063_07870 [Gallionellales bacterium GWA2_60_142]|nr:MAG: hypothetical protein A2063_07870 [Gallionellales bacterium GWA2_60_142]HCI13668.1 hypothetical protein [Gallionellaceae bacterium]
MNVNSTTSAIQLGSIPQSQPTARNQEPQTQQATQESSVVKLSTRAIQMSQAANQNQEASETAPRETAEPASVQRAESEANQSRRIDTFA